jgi:hypothetical protein
MYQILNSGDYKKLSLVVKSIFQTKGLYCPFAAFFLFAGNVPKCRKKKNYSAEWQKKLKARCNQVGKISKTATRGGPCISQPTHQSQYKKKIA